MNDLKNRLISYDCRFYAGDRPCIWHKQEGLLCKCRQYEPTKETLLIIKLDAIGDVLRTTCLLPVIAKAWTGIKISWITRPESVPLLENNPYIAEVIPYGMDAFVHLSSRTFDRVVNLDAGKTSAGMAALASAGHKTGYVMHEAGYVTGTNQAAEEWLRMGVFDDLKKVNKRSYQDIMCSILGLPADGMEYVLKLTDAELKNADDHLKKIGIALNKHIIGIHTGGGGRWRLKQWKEESFIQLISELAADPHTDAQILLFGGPLEAELNKRIAKSVNGTVFDAGSDNALRHFASLVKQCSVILSADSLAMHIALATGRRTVVLFGPTSSSEIELFGLGEKIIAPLECVSCYKKECDIIPNCMDSLSVEVVKKAVLRQLHSGR